MKNTKKRILTVVMIITLLFIMVLPTIANASVSDIEIPKPNPVEDEGAKTLAGDIIGYIQLIGVVVAVVMIVWHGIRFFTESPEKQADLKKAFMGYLIGAACIFGAVGILQLVKTSLTKVIK